MKTILTILLSLVTATNFAQPITISNQRNKTYTGQAAASIKLLNDTNITLILPVVANSTGIGISIVSCANVTITHATVHDQRFGIVATQSTNVRIDTCYIYNMHSANPNDLNHPVQLDNSTGRIVGNRILCDTLTASQDDAINIWQSYGTQAALIVVSGNYINGGTSWSGVGIQLGDGGGAWQIATDNVIINPGGCGAGIAGNNVSFINNVVYGSHRSITNVGLDVEGKKGSTATITGNQVYWFNNAGISNPYYKKGVKVTGWSNKQVNLKMTIAGLLK